MDISQKIHALRIEQNMTLEQVAKFVGVSKSTVSKWESGYIANMRRDKIAKLATFLDTTPGYLLGWTDDAPPAPPSDDWDGSIVKEIRESIGESTANAALSLGIPLDQYIKIENGTSAPSLGELKKMAFHFKYSADRLLGLVFANAPAAGLSDDECKLITDYRQLNNAGKEYIRQTMCMALRSYSKKNDAVPDVETAM